MFAIGDKVEVSAEEDVFFRSKGVVKETFVSDTGWLSLGVEIGNTEDIGSPVLWYSHNELRKVEG